MTPATTNSVSQASIIDGYPINVVVSRNGTVLSSVDNGSVSVSLTDTTRGCGASGSAACLQLQAAAGSNAVALASLANNYSYANGVSVVYVGAHASVAQTNVSISGVAFTVAASVAVDGIQASSSIRVIIQ